MNQAEKDNWEQYSLAGQKRALELGNRGPMRFEKSGLLEQDILDAYFRTGFYVFTGVISREEVAHSGKNLIRSSTMRRSPTITRRIFSDDP